jgi:hypothetical protein
MITDFFSHKIHSSNEEWQNKLVDIATVFSEFDGLPYDRTNIEERFKLISPRASIIARDPSKYRDEISAYPAYLGLYRLQLEHGKWIFRLSETAKRFLIVEEPNVPAFMLLQLLLFQYPNGMGARYNSNGNVIIQANARDKTLEFINDNIHVSPLRLICKALAADAQLNGITSNHPRISIDEVYVLANDSRTNKQASPLLVDVIEVLEEARNGLLLPPSNFESRFHILNHTDFIQVTNGWIHIREALSPEDSESLLVKLDIINGINTQFTGLDLVTNQEDLTNVIASGAWGKYFDGVVNLTAEIVQGLTNETVYTGIIQNNIAQLDGDDIILDNTSIRFKYPLKERDGSLAITSNGNRVRQTADPEVTRIKRQRSNLQHKILTQKMDEHLRKIGAVPYENEHIDLLAKIPKDGTFLFEVKSVSSENLLSQTRKGLSQLYEYHYRYKTDLESDVTLCLIYPHEPNEIEWLQEYLCNDRGVAICWFDNEKLSYPLFCSNKMDNLIL